MPQTQCPEWSSRNRMADIICEGDQDTLVGLDTMPLEKRKETPGHV